jgi:hypothetical protein
VTFCSGNILGKVFGNEYGSESRPSGEEASIDSLRPSFDDRAETCPMKILHKVGKCFHVLCAVDKWQTEG